MKLFDNTEENRRRFGELTRYADDFRIETVTDAKGKARRKTVYIGAWTVLRDKGRGTVFRLWGSLTMSFAAVAACALQLLTEHSCDRKYTVMLPLLAGLFPCLYLLMGCLSLPFRLRPMRRDQYMHSFIRVFRSATAVICFEAITLIASFIYRISAGDWVFLAGDRRFVMYGGLALAFSGVLIRLLRGIGATEMPNSRADGHGQISKET